MRRRMAILCPKIRGDQIVLVIPRQSARIVANLDTSERTIKRRRIKRRRGRRKILIMSPRRKMEMFPLQPWPLMQVTMHG